MSSSFFLTGLICLNFEPELYLINYLLKLNVQLSFDEFSKNKLPVLFLGGTAPISPSKQPKMPLVKEEQEPPLTNGHHNNDDDNLQLNGEKNPSNGNGTIYEENGDSVSTFKTSEAVEAAPEAVEAPPAAPVDEAPPMVAAAE